MLEWEYGEGKMCRYAFEFVAGKFIPAFFGALSRVAEGLQKGSGDAAIHHAPDKARKFAGDSCFGDVGGFPAVEG